MHSALDAILLDMPRAAALWLLILAIVPATVLAVTRPRRRPTPATAGRSTAATRLAAAARAGVADLLAGTAARLATVVRPVVLHPAGLPAGVSGRREVGSPAGAGRPAGRPEHVEDADQPDSTLDLTGARLAAGLLPDVPAGAVDRPVEVFLDPGDDEGAWDWDGAWDELAEPMSADDQWRYADEIAVVAARAADTADRLRREWQDADRDAEEAWAAFDAADRAARRARAATAFPATPVGPQECERYLHRAAVAACRRREIAVAELSEILAHRGWDPTRQPVEQEAALRERVRESRLAGYLRAAAREREAWHAADVAAASVRSLRDEAFAARQEAELRPADSAAVWLEEQLRPEIPAQRRVGVAVR
jgi:hypothetical protein